MTYAHQQTITENNIDEKTLPKEIREEIRLWNLLASRKTPTESLLKTMEKNSIVIANDIIDWLENDKPTEEEFTAEQTKAAEAKAKADKAESEAKAAKEVAEKETARIALENQIKEIIQKEGQISDRKIKSLVSDAVISNTVTIGSLVLRRVPLTSNYR